MSTGALIQARKQAKAARTIADAWENCAVTMATHIDLMHEHEPRLPFGVCHLCDAMQSFQETAQSMRPKPPKDPPTNPRRRSRQ